MNARNNISIGSEAIDQLIRWAHEQRALCDTLHAQVDGARVYAGLIEKIEEAVRNEARQTLSLSEAALYTGKSRRTIERQIARCEVQNLGRKGKPLLCKGDLIPAPVSRVASERQSSNLLAADVRSVASLITGDGNDKKEKSKKRVA